MPFTLSHAVLAPPLNKLSKGYLPVAALTIGSMTPDLYRLFTVETYNITHQWQGLITPDLWIGTIFCLLWYLLYRPCFYRFFHVHHPLQLHTRWAKLRFILFSGVALLLGISTHIIWDGFTHADFRTIAFYDTLLRPIPIAHSHYPLHRVLQIASSVIAVPFLIFFAGQYFQAHRTDSTLRQFPQFLFGSLLVLASALGVYACIHNPQLILLHPWKTHLYDVLGKSFNLFTQIWLIVVTLGCLLWQIITELKLNK